MLCIIITELHFSCIHTLYMLWKITCFINLNIYLYVLLTTGIYTIQYMNYNPNTGFIYNEINMLLEIEADLFV